MFLIERTQKPILALWFLKAFYSKVGYFWAFSAFLKFIFEKLCLIGCTESLRFTKWVWSEEQFKSSFS